MDLYHKQRLRMVESQIRRRGIRDERVLKVMEAVPRHLFVDEALRDQAYQDHPLPIDAGQTISQPYMVALMTEALSPSPTDRVLEIGTGSGYQAAILSRLCAQVYSVERIAALATRARKVLDELGYYNIHIRVGDGTLGWSQEAPFDGIVVTAGAPHVPEALVDQLAVGGRLVIPVGDQSMQDLKRCTRTPQGVREESLGGCRFVRLIGKNGWQD